MTGSDEIRQAFLDYFAARGHAVVASSPLVPANDPSLLFTNAGMVQFKDVFLGRETRDPPRAASAQRCLRAGGKHNDLENVGYTARHHTFFEMLGNFSFGDYFKEEAIAYCWEFLTDTLALEPARLWVSVYEEDDEAARLWCEGVGVDPKRLVRLGAAENFWAMGDTGPCGPCSEVYYDHGAAVPGGPPGADPDSERYVEIWNLVFMQYRRDAGGGLEPLPRPSVDTGMGLERIAAVLQGVADNYATDLFAPLLGAVAARAGRTDAASGRVIADHLRAAGFLLMDGVLPSNEGRGYVLRRIVRRALRHGSKLGLDGPFFHELVAPLVQAMGAAHPELAAAQERIEAELAAEEERFAQTLQTGLRVLDDGLAQLQGKTVPGELAFLLYDTYGFPLDLTRDAARERGLEVDEADYGRRMEEQRERARGAAQFAVDYAQLGEVAQDGRFSGYERLAQDTEVVALYRDGRSVQELAAGEEAVAVLAETPFYAEAGGQVGDTGRLSGPGGEFEVGDTQKHGQAHLHVGRMGRGRLRVGDAVAAEVDAARRQSVVLNHSATHLLHAALRRVLGEHVAQKGSLVAPDRLRFDFAHPRPVAPEELRRIEEMVNAAVRANWEVTAATMGYDEALAAGALAFFGDKYGDRVRVLRMGDFSTELCGGTHVRRTGDIGLFRLAGETGIAAGVRRIEALTGATAHRQALEQQATLARAAELLKTAPGEVLEKLGRLAARKQELERELERLQGQRARQAGADLAAQAVEVDGMRVLAARLDDADAKSLRAALDRLKERLGSAAVVLGAARGGKVALVAGVTADQCGRLPAGELVSAVAAQVGGRGGGRPEMAQGGGDRPEALDAALAAVPDWIRGRLRP